MSGNPFGAEIDALTNEIIHLNAQIAGATGAAADNLSAERSAKVQAVAKIDALSEDWRLGRLSQSVEALKTMAASELARQARIVDRLKRIMVAQGITPPVQVTEQVAPAVTISEVNVADVVVIPPVVPEVTVSPTIEHSTVPTPQTAPHLGIPIDARAFGRALPRCPKRGWALCEAWVRSTGRWTLRSC